MPLTQVWKGIYDARRRGEFGAGEARRRFAYAYWMGLREAGYKYVVRPKLISSPDGRPLYFLFFASDHPAGDRIMTHILERPRGFEQLSMPMLQDPWDFSDGEGWYTAALNAGH